jgi:hypothetical protein
MVEVTDEDAAAGFDPLRPKHMRTRIRVAELRYRSPRAEA